MDAKLEEKPVVVSERWKGCPFCGALPPPDPKVTGFPVFAPDRTARLVPGRTPQASAWKVSCLKCDVEFTFFVESRSECMVSWNTRLPVTTGLSVVRVALTPKPVEEEKPVVEKTTKQKPKAYSPELGRFDHKVDKEAYARTFLEALDRYGGNSQAAAKELQLSMATFYKRLRDYVRSGYVEQQGSGRGCRNTVRWGNLRPQSSGDRAEGEDRSSGEARAGGVERLAPSQSSIWVGQGVRSVNGQSAPPDQRERSELGGLETDHSGCLSEGYEGSG